MTKASPRDVAPASTTGTGAEIAVETRLSHSEPAEGPIVVAGHDLFELVRTSSYEAIGALLWREILPGRMTRDALGQARVAAFSRLKPVFPVAADVALSVVERQRLLVSFVPRAQMDPLTMVATVGVAAAAATRLAAGAEPLAPQAEASHAADLLRTARGRSAEVAEERAFDVYLGLMIDHGVNASTFAARVAASTASGIAAAAIAGLCTLEGIRHGGAPGAVLDMLDAASASTDPEAWLAETLNRGERLMGFGSRAYAGRDPRAALLKAATAGLPPQARTRLAFAERMEAAAEALFASRGRARPLHTNVEFYAAILLDALGLPRGAFTPVFAAARSAGWAAHIAEQERHGRMIRPSTRYRGPAASTEEGSRADLDET